MEFVDNYKRVRDKFMPAAKPIMRAVEQPKPPVAEVREQPLPQPEKLAKYGAGEHKRDISRDMQNLVTEAEKRGISYYQRLIEHVPVMPKSKKLAILVVLEEYAISWDELFTKDRPAFKSIIRWKVFRAMRDEGMSLGEIARICDVDHTSVMHGLRKVSSEDLK